MDKNALLQKERIYDVIKKDKHILPYPEYVNTSGIQCENLKFSKEDFRFKLSIPFVGNSDKGMLMVIMKNPSKANEERCDQTIMKVCRTAYTAGYSGVVIINLFPYRATKASDVYKYYFNKECYESSMKANYDIIKSCCEKQEVVFAWGTNTISSSKEFREEYDKRIEEIVALVKSCASKTTRVYKNEKYPIHGLRWWKTMLVDDDYIIHKKGYSVDHS